MRNLRTAFGLLTTLPFGMPENWLPGDSGRAGVWYPLVGVVIGGVTWLIWLALTLYFPPLVVGVLTLLVWVAMTGGLHLDGLADCCDGLFVSTTPDLRLEIMKDPHLGHIWRHWAVACVDAQSSCVEFASTFFWFGHYTGGDNQPLVHPSSLFAAAG